jgi:enamine deaminase RidA (YjgF/YER057c/UK114 family)
MQKQFVNPPEIHPARGYTHVVTVEGGGKLVFVAGQVALNKEMQLVGAGDLRAQARQALQNLVAALASVGATPADVVKITTYVVNYKSSDVQAIGEARRDVFGRENPPASTLVGVQALAVEGLLIEVEAIAVMR